MECVGRVGRTKSSNMGKVLSRVKDGRTLKEGVAGIGVVIDGRDLRRYRK